MSMNMFKVIAKGDGACGVGAIALALPFYATEVFAEPLTLAAKLIIEQIQKKYIDLPQNVLASELFNIYVARFYSNEALEDDLKTILRSAIVSLISQEAEQLKKADDENTFYNLFWSAFKFYLSQLQARLKGEKFADEEVTTISAVPEIKQFFNDILTGDEAAIKNANIDTYKLKYTKKLADEWPNLFDNYLAYIAKNNTPLTEFELSKLANNLNISLEKYDVPKDIHNVVVSKNKSTASASKISKVDNSKITITLAYRSGHWDLLLNEEQHKIFISKVPNKRIVSIASSITRLANSASSIGSSQSIGLITSTSLSDNNSSIYLSASNNKKDEFDEELIEPISNPNAYSNQYQKTFLAEQIQNDLVKQVNTNANQTIDDIFAQALANPSLMTQKAKEDFAAEKIDALFEASKKTFESDLDETKIENLFAEFHRTHQLKWPRITEQNATAGGKSTAHESLHSSRRTKVGA